MTTKARRRGMRSLYFDRERLKRFKINHFPLLFFLCCVPAIGFAQEAAVEKKESKRELHFTGVTFFSTSECCPSDRWARGSQGVHGISCGKDRKREGECKSWFSAEAKKPRKPKEYLESLLKTNAILKTRDPSNNEEEWYQLGWRAALLFEKNLVDLKGKIISDIFFVLDPEVGLIAYLRTVSGDNRLAYMDAQGRTYAVPAGLNTFSRDYFFVVPESEKFRIEVSALDSNGGGCDFHGTTYAETYVWKYKTKKLEKIQSKRGPESEGSKGCNEGPAACSPLIDHFNPLSWMPDQWCAEKCSKSAADAETACNPENDPPHYKRVGGPGYGTIGYTLIQPPL